MNYSTFLSGPGQRAPALRGSEAPRVHLLRPRRAEEARGAQVRVLGQVLLGLDITKSSLSWSTNYHQNYH